MLLLDFFSLMFLVVLQKGKSLLLFATQRLKFLRFAPLPQGVNRHLRNNSTRIHIEFEQ